MFLILLALMLIGFAFWLSWHSMRDFLDFIPSPFGLYLIQNSKGLNQEFFTTLKSILKDPSLKAIDPKVVSFEKLFKGSDRALILALPSQVAARFPELNLLELEDYTKKVHLSSVLAFEVGTQKRIDNLSLDLSHIKLAENEYLFLQLVTDFGAHPLQATIRISIIAKDSQRRVEIAKQVEGELKKHGLSRVIKNLSSLKIFEGFQKRGLVPREVKRFEIKLTDIQEFLS